MESTHRVVAGWILDERIGSGGFGEVWRARRRHADLHRALKLIPISSDHAFASWRHEISRLEELSHPNIVRFYDADIVSEEGPYRDCAWIATELCVRSLADELRRRPGRVLTTAEGVALLDAMLGALAAAHDGDCVHRDVKPGNILLHPSGAWKLADFGTARLIPQGEDHPRTAVVGTFPYMSPAAHRGRQDQAADLYALGVTLHEALCGSRLHSRAEGMTDSEYVKLVLDTPPRISTALDPRWRAAIATLIGAYGDHSAAEIQAWFHQSRGAYDPPTRPRTAGPPTAGMSRPATPATPSGAHGGAVAAATGSPTEPAGTLDGAGHFGARGSFGYPDDPRRPDRPGDPGGAGRSSLLDGVDHPDDLDVTRQPGHPPARRAGGAPTPPQGVPVVRPGRRRGRGQRRQDRRVRRRDRRERKQEADRRDNEHLLPILALIGISLAVAAALLYTLIPYPAIVTAIIGTVLVALLLLLVLS